ncbi:MAG TPA: D-alanyl-D-alanine carboxypeptidase family protein [Bacillota bacterium]|nr:D-alanyl-D-alanine carboxypeptidase family protein [Bacillota bacterium]
MRAVAAILAMILAAAWVPPAALAAAMPAQRPTPRAVPAASVPQPKVTADAAVLIDAATGTILWSRQATQSRAPASTTKMMTALLALELGNPDDPVTVGPDAVNVEGSSIYLRAGERIALSELLKGLLLKSANDAAVAIADHIAGSTAAFADLMNARAKQLGLANTHFTNPHGLTQPDHYASAYDLALLARAAMAYPAFAAIVRSPTGAMEGLSPDETSFVRGLRNTNRLLLTYDWVDGVKTGTTRAAGNCLVASGARGGQRLIAVVLHSDNRWGDAIQLLEYGYAAYAFVPVAQTGQLIATVRVSGARNPYVGLVAARSLAVPVPVADQARVSVTASVSPNPAAPLQAGERVGQLTATLDGRVLAQVDLVAARTVVRAPWWWFLVRWLGS